MREIIFDHEFGIPQVKPAEGQALVLHTMFLPQDMIPTRHDHQILPIHRALAANSAPEFRRALRQHTTAAVIDRQNAGPPTCINLTIMDDSTGSDPYDPALAGLYS